MQRRMGRSLMHSVDGGLEQRQASWRESNTRPDHYAVIGRSCQLLVQHQAGCFVGWNQAKVRLPSALRHFAQSDRNSGMDLLGIEAPRYGGIGEVHRLRLLADEQYACHVIFLHAWSAKAICVSSAA